MSTRTLVWTLALVAFALVLVPFVGMLPMGGWATDGGTMSGGMMGGGAMIGMHIGGIVWLILTIIVIAALVALLVLGNTKA